MIEEKPRVPNQPAKTSVYIIRRQRGGIKIGLSINPTARKSTLQSATPDRLELIWSGEFDDAPGVEGRAKTLLKPWRISGEWFDAGPFMAGLAIEGAHTGNERIAVFMACMATNRSDCFDEQAAKDFPDLYARLSFPERDQWTDWTGKKHDLPHKKFTRVIVAGFPETTYGCPKAPWHRQAIAR
jgi:hypothetical protein